LDLIVKKKGSIISGENYKLKSVQNRTVAQFWTDFSWCFQLSKLWNHSEIWNIFWSFL